jgi:hypothetical protein
MLFRVTILAGLFLAASDFPSGPQVGDKLPPCKVQAFSGPEAGKEMELVKQIKGGPALVIFVHKITRPALKLLRPIDKAAADLIEAKKIHGHIVWLAEDKQKAEEYLKRAKDSLNLQTPIAICLDGKDGPATYGLNDKVTLTILLVNHGKVVGNFALADPNETDARKILPALKKLVGMGK